MTDAPPTAGLGRPKPAGRLRTLGRVAFVVAAVALLVTAVYREREDFGAALSALDAGTVISSFSTVLVALVLNMLAWRAAMGAVGVRLPLASAARAFFLSQLGKYVPGSVWPVVAQVELTRDMGVPRLRSAVGAMVTMIVGVVTSSVVACALLVLPDAAIRTHYWWLLLVVPVAAISLHPAVLRRLLRLALRITRRSTAVPDLSGVALVRATLWSATMWLTFGVHAWLLADNLAAPGLAALPTVTGAFALAWVAGFFVVVAPAGIGVREGVLILALDAMMSTTDALALALVSRVLLTLGDGLMAAAATAVHKRMASQGNRDDAGTTPPENASEPAQPDEDGPSDSG